MSNNQKAVKYNPSDSKNVIQFALLRSFIESFNLFNLHYQTLNAVLSLKHKALSSMPSGYIHPSAWQMGHQVRSWEYCLLLKVYASKLFQALILSISLFRGDDSGR